MKTFFTIALGLVTFFTATAQSNYFNEAYRFNKFLDRVNSPQGEKLMYGDIEGNAYFAKTFISAKIESATSTIKARYNTYTDTVELLNEDEIFELPKSAKYSPITFQNPRATLVYLNENSLPAGYYFELVKGKYTLLKKMKTEFREGSKAVNSFTPAIAPRFENLRPEYFFKTDSGIITITKDARDLVKSLPEKKEETATFIKKNKIKLNAEEDMVQLATFLNAAE